MVIYQLNDCKYSCLAEIISVRINHSFAHLIGFMNCYQTPIVLIAYNFNVVYSSWSSSFPVLLCSCSVRHFFNKKYNFSLFLRFVMNVESERERERERERKSKRLWREISSLRSLAGILSSHLSMVAFINAYRLMTHIRSSHQSNFFSAGNIGTFCIWAFIRYFRSLYLSHLISHSNVSRPQLTCQLVSHFLFLQAYVIFIHWAFSH